MTAFYSALYLHNALWTVHTGETMHCKPYFKDWQFFSECICVAATQFKYLPPITWKSFMGDTVMPVYMYNWTGSSLQWRHHGHDGVSTHRRLYCLLNRLFRRISKETSKLPVTGLGEGKPPVTIGFLSQKASNECFNLMTSKQSLHQNTDSFLFKNAFCTLTSILSSTQSVRWNCCCRNSQH